MNEALKQPQGELVIRTIAMPADTNFNGDIFGGWLLCQMDLGGAVAARKYANSRITTVAINDMTFRHPVQVGDTLCCYAKFLRCGTKSMTFNINAWIRRQGTGEHVCVTDADFTYVAIDEQGQSIPIDHQGRPA